MLFIIDSEYVEGIICHEDDIKENEMKTFKLGEDGEVLLVKQNGKLTATGTRCSHFNAPLVTGALGEGRVRCPWHGACFNLETGDIEDFPGLDSIPCYKVTVVEGQVSVKAKKTDLKSNRIIKEMTSQTGQETFVVIGGGPSGGVCVEVLRQEGFTGRIVIVCKEAALPYDRIFISKYMTKKLSEIEFRTEEFYTKNSIEVIKGVEATKVDTELKTVRLSNGETIKWDKLYIATGSKANKLNIPGSDLPQVVTVRNHSDAVYIQEMLAPEKHVVVLGFSFIALEAASYCVNLVDKVTIVGRDSAPLKSVFGEEIGTGVMNWFKTKNINFLTNSGIKKCIEHCGKLAWVELNDGQRIKADILIMGVGTKLYTKFLENSGITLNQNGSINTNDYLETNIANVYAGGDIANAPVFSSNGDRATIGHYGLSQYHGKIAGLNMAGKKTMLKAVPVFWTRVFETLFLYCGHGSSTHIQIVGSVDKLDFVAFYFDKNEKVIAMLARKGDGVPYVPHFAEFLSQGKSLYKNQLTVDHFFWIKK